MNISTNSKINDLSDNLAAAGISVESMKLTGKNLELRLQDYDSQFSDMCVVAVEFAKEFTFTVPKYKTAFTYADFQ